MSLINDALKKAQKQRTGEAPPLANMPSIGGESATRIAKRAKPAGFNSLLLRLGLGAAGVALVLVVGGYFLFRARPAAKPASPSSAVVGQQISAPVEKTPQEPPRNPPAEVRTASASNPAAAKSEPATTFTLPIANPPTPTPAPVAARPETAAQPVVTTKAPAPVSAPQSSPAAPPAPAAKMDGKSITYIENLKIAGIRASATDAKVLMNDRVYRIGDIVEHEMGLKIIGITSGSLTFENEAGAKYTRNF